MIEMISPGKYPIRTISNEEMDEAVKREREISALRIAGYPMFRSPDGRLFPLKSDDCTVEDTDDGYFTIVS